MAWVKIDDHFDEHPKLAAIGPLGWGIWLAGLAYCNRNLTDGFIPWNKARLLASFEIVEPDGRLWRLSRSSGMMGEDIESEWVIAVLVEAGIWDEVPGGYKIHDYEDYQPTKAQVLAEREKKAAAGRAGGQATAQARATAGATSESKQRDGTRSSKTEAKSKPVPVPVPDPLEEEASASSLGAEAPKRKRATALPDDFTLTDQLRAFASGRDFTDAEIDLEFQKFTAYWQGEGRTKKDWPATWRSWILNAVERRPAQPRNVTPFQNNGTRKGGGMSSYELADYARELEARERQGQ